MIFRAVCFRAPLACCLITIWLITPPAPGQSSQRIALTYDYFGAAESQGRFYLPIPPETSGQRIESFHSSWSGSEISNATSPTQRWLTGVVPASGRLHWHVRVVAVFARKPMGTPSDRAAPAESFGRATAALDWDSAEFQDWLERHNLRRAPGEGVSVFVRRLYDYLTEHGAYTYPPEGGWTASGASRRLRTDCGGFSLVFVAACRANHVPARLLVGQWLKPSPGGNEVTHQAHVVAEFYDPAGGWTPVDVSSGLTHVGGRDYFGSLPGYFFTWHFDTDYQFGVPPGANGHVQWIQNPSPWFADGGGEGGSHRWTIDPLP